MKLNLKLEKKNIYENQKTKTLRKMEEKGKTSDRLQFILILIGIHNEIGVI